MNWIVVEAIEHARHLLSSLSISRNARTESIVASRNALSVVAALPVPGTIAREWTIATP